MLSGLLSKKVETEEDVIEFPVEEREWWFEDEVLVVKEEDDDDDDRDENEDCDDDKWGVDGLSVETEFDKVLLRSSLEDEAVPDPWFLPKSIPWVVLVDFKSNWTMTDLNKLVESKAGKTW